MGASHKGCNLCMFVTLPLSTLNMFVFVSTCTKTTAHYRLWHDALVTILLMLSDHRSPANLMVPTPISQ